MTQKADVVVRGGVGPWTSVYLLSGLSAAGRTWLAVHVPDAERGCEAVAVEHRYLHDICTGMKDDGLAVRLAR